MNKDAIKGSEEFAKKYPTVCMLERNVLDFKQRFLRRIVDLEEVENREVFRAKVMDLENNEKSRDTFFHIVCEYVKNQKHQEELVDLFDKSVFGLDSNI